MTNEQDGKQYHLVTRAEKNPQYKQKSQNVYSNNKRNLCPCYANNK